DSLNSALKDIEAGKEDSWTVSLALGDISFDKDALAGLLDAMTGDSVDITIEQASNKDLSAKQREATGDRPVYDINITSGKKNISQFGGKLTISLPYTLKEGERPSGIVVYHLDAEGNLVPMKGAYDPVAGKIVFTVDHLSYFVIGYDEALAKWPFIDVAEDDSVNWFYSPVKFVYERGIFSGTGANTFSPNSPLTRSMLASVLARMSGADLAGYEEVSFGDVAINSWYGPSVAWAKETGIVSGYANKDGSYDFRPDAKISRQDIAVMLNNYNEKVTKKAYSQTASTVTFTDHKQIAEYAKTAVLAMQQAGIINGIKNADGSFRFQPINNATRAEAATMIYNMLINK
ncbi:MAG: S-layer homology domain-containing protein, partial [Anaerovoracaceae bacterium]